MLNFAIDIAREAGAILVQRLGGAKVSNKGDIDLVTEADIASEELIIDWIRSYDPQHAILAEESGELVNVGAQRSDWKLSLIHISEPTRLLSISYAVFCLKKKK